MKNIDSILVKGYIEELKKIYGDHLRAVILYGSYARGDQREDSDIDLMILVDLDDMTIKTYHDSLSALDYEYLDKHDVEINPIVKNEGHFYKWVEAYPFYNNVKNDGVNLYAA